MPQEHVADPELLNLIALLAHLFEGTPVEHFLHSWENVFFSWLAMGGLIGAVFFASRKMSLIPDRWQSLFEILVEGVVSFFGNILGPRGKNFIPLVGTLFIYILFMNLMGLIPFLKSPTANLSITVALALCVFIPFMYTAFRELGFLGFVDHLAGSPRGAMARMLILPLFLFILEVMTIMIRPVTLSLRLRGNIWGEDLMMAILAGFGIVGVPVLLFVSFLAIIASIVQALVFSLLTTVYFSLILNHGDSEHQSH